MATNATAANAAQNRGNTLDLPDWLLNINHDVLKMYLEWARWAFQKAFLCFLGAMLALMVLSIGINTLEDWRQLNFLFVILLAIGAIYHAFHPYWFLTAFGLGAVVNNGLPNIQVGEIIKFKFPDFQLPVFLRAGWEGAKGYWNLLRVVWVFFFMWFAVLGTIPVNLGAVIPVSAVLLAWGALSKGSKWYFWACSAITALMSVIWLYGLFFSGSDVERFVTSRATPLIAEPLRVQNLVVSTKPVPLSHFVDRNSDGFYQEGERTIPEIEPGCYRFSADGPDTAWSHHPGQLYDLGDIVRLNGNDQNHNFPVREGESITVSFDPSFGHGRLVETGPGGYEAVDITLIASSGPDCEA